MKRLRLLSTELGRPLLRNSLYFSLLAGKLDRRAVRSGLHPPPVSLQYPSNISRTAGIGGFRGELRDFQQQPVLEKLAGDYFPPDRRGILRLAKRQYRSEMGPVVRVRGLCESGSQRLQSERILHARSTGAGSASQKVSRPWRLQSRGAFDERPVSTNSAPRDPEITPSTKSGHRTPSRKILPT
jgi:hypothetical protein